MKYMLLIYSDEDNWTEDEREACMRQSMAICDELAAAGTFVAASPLHSVSTATSVRVRDGHRLITDRPFAETTEQLGGYYIIDVSDLDEALAVASRLPPVRKGTVEIRPLFDLSALAREPDGEGLKRPEETPFAGSPFAGSPAEVLNPHAPRTAR